MRINLLKRLESSVYSFRLTIDRIRKLIDDTISIIKSYQSGGSMLDLTEISGDDFDYDDQNTDLFSVGKKVKIDLADMDYPSWLHELEKDAENLELLSLMISDITPEHDAKLQTLFEVIQRKIGHPINPGNKKIIIFTAFSDTADYLFANVSAFAKKHFGLETAEITGSVDGKTTIPGLRADLNTVLTCFSPVSKGKAVLLPGKSEELDILIATDCISEGQNLQDCDYLINYDMDANVLGNDVHSINVLTVIASESYDSFAKGLQSELAEAVANRPMAVTADLFKGKVIVDARGNEQVVDSDTAQVIFEELVISGYVKRGVLTDKYYEDKANGKIKVAEEVADSRDAIINIIDSVYDSRAMQPENARDKNVELKVDPDKLAMPEFKALWKRISPKSVYVVDFDTDELVQKAIMAINQKLYVSKIFFKVETGTMDEIKSKDALVSGNAFSKAKASNYDSSKRIHANSSVKYDLIGKLVGETGLTRKAVVQILTGIDKTVFEQFKFNPEEFIIKAAELINDEKATAIIEHITYNVLDERYDTDIFTEPTIKGKLGVNAMKAQRHLYDHIVYDSSNERDFAVDLDTNTDVAVYVKLPDSFYISTPVGHYNPDWAIAFYEGTVKHIYFVAETKGSMSSMQLRLIEESKIHCAREHFKAISNENVVYEVVDSYQTLLNMVMK